MILDNVDDKDAVAAVAKLMPRLNSGHVVVTARASNFPASVRKVEVPTLDENAAAQFLLDRTDGDRSKSRDDPALARTLSRELGGLALGLEQAGAHIATDHIGFARYLRLWGESRDRLLGWTDETLTGSERNLATTWATSVARLSPDSRRLLERLAFLAPDPVPDSFLDVAVPGEAGNFGLILMRALRYAYSFTTRMTSKHADSANSGVTSGRAGLYAYSLISGVTAEDGGAPGFVVHRLVQDFARHAMSEERRTQALREALEWVNAAFAGDPQDVRSWPTLDPLAPHALAVARRADEAQIAELTGRMFNSLGLLLTAKADYVVAEPLYRRALAIAEQSCGPDHPQVAGRLNNLALLLQDTNRLAEAGPLMRRALAIDETELRPGSSQCGAEISTISRRCFRTRTASPKPEPLMRRALAIDETSYGPDHPNVAIRLNNLAQLLQATNRLAEAEPLMRRALAIDEKSYGPDHPDVAIDLNNLAQLLQATNRLAEAEPLMRRALAIDETELRPGPSRCGAGPQQSRGVAAGHEPPRRGGTADAPRAGDRREELRPGPSERGERTSTISRNCFKTTNRLAEAEPLMRRALVIDGEELRPDHPDVANNLNNLAQLLQATNRLAEAEPLMRRALAIDEKSYGPDHPDVARDLNDLALLLQATNRLAEAEPLMRRALAIDEKSLGPDHPNTAKARTNLVALEAALGKGSG